MTKNAMPPGLRVNAWECSICAGMFSERDHDFPSLVLKHVDESKVVNDSGGSKCNYLLLVNVDQEDTIKAFCHWCDSPLYVFGFVCPLCDDFSIDDEEAVFPVGETVYCSFSHPSNPADDSEADHELVPLAEWPRHWKDFHVFQLLYCSGNRCDYRDVLQRFIDILADDKALVPFQEWSRLFEGVQDDAERLLAGE